MAAESKTDKRIAALMERLEKLDPDLRAEIVWLAGRYHRLDRNLEKISRMSDRMQGQIMELNDQLRAASITDPLTGLINRRGMHDALHAEAKAADEDGHGFYLLLIDIDHFKAVNDTYGHDVGDEVLIDFSSRLTGAVRSEDKVSRWGGEEFLVLLPRTSTEDAMMLTEGFHEMLRSRPVKTAVGPLRITASSGLSAYFQQDHGFDKVIYRADQALYAAKDAGRDQWILAEGP